MSGLETTPPEILIALGFFVALSLRQGRLEPLIDKFLGSVDK